jgi:hypothetical protein
MATTDTPEIMCDTDGATIGALHELEIGTICALADGAFMLDFDQIVGRHDLEALHSLIGKVLECATGAGSLAAGA